VLAERGTADHALHSEELRNFVRGQLTIHVDPDVLNPFSTASNRSDLLKRRIHDAVVDKQGRATPALVDSLFDDIVGLGPLQPLMDDRAITDILVNRFDEIFVERGGRLQYVPNAFRDQAQLEQVIQKIVALVGREINIDKPLVDARMVDGSRANAVYAPVGGPTLCIRKFNRVRLALLPSDRAPGEASWVSSGGLSMQMGAFLEAMAVARANILIAGATGSGKSTLLRSIVSAFPEARARHHHRRHGRTGAGQPALGEARVRALQRTWREGRARTPPGRGRPRPERLAHAAGSADHRRDPA